MTLLRTGSNKVVASEDLPDLPVKQVKKLKQAIQNICYKFKPNDKANEKAQTFNTELVNDIRRAFFNFFIEPLKHFTSCLKV